jgi:hypothetical protein
MPALARIDPDGRREGRTVTDGCSSPPWTYGSDDHAARVPARPVSNKLSSTAPTDGSTTMDNPGRSYAVDSPRHGGRASLIRQKSGAITGARPTGRLGATKDDDGEESMSARLSKSRRAPGRMHGRNLRIRRLGVRIPPGAPASPPVSGTFASGPPLASRRLASPPASSGPLRGLLL